MSPRLRLALVVHNHQPVGNFDHVVERAYLDSYRPLVDALAKFPRVRAALHLSGSLFDWLEERHPDYLDDVAALRARGQVEVLGGGYYEPILPMIPRRDRLGQIRDYSAKLTERFGAPPSGMWLAERVWEQQLAGDLAAAGMQYTLVDDFHFRNAGLRDDQLRGYFLTEDEGRLLAVFPGNERLRYLLPFAAPEETIQYLRDVAAAQPGATLVFADDGEKFGSWPGTREHCHERGWLHRFFAMLSAEPWIETTTPGDVIADVEPQGKIYLPDGSYREMTEWASLETAAVPDHLGRIDVEPRHGRPTLRTVPGTWRNFLVKYPEAAEMRARMLMVSDRVERAAQAGYPAEIVDAARRELYKSQCNCAYWHGTFGGVYLAHLRQAVFRHLIRADNILDRTADRPEHWVEAVVRDHNLDVHQEVCLAGDRLMAFVAPHQGGCLYELDVRAAARNVLATAARRPEPYHAEARSQTAAPPSDGAPAPTYDREGRRSLVDRFYASLPPVADLAAGRAVDLGDFAGARYHFHVRREANSASVTMWRLGRVDGHPIKLTKIVSLTAGAAALSIVYRLENLPTDRTFTFAPEFNLAGFGDGEARYAPTAGRLRTTRSAVATESAEVGEMELVDTAWNLDVRLAASRPAVFLSYPAQALNRWERGYETTHQALCLAPAWNVQADAHGCWDVTLTLPIESTAGELVRRGAAGEIVPADLGDLEPRLTYPAAQIVTQTEVVRGKPELRRKTTRRMKAAS